MDLKGRFPLLRFIQHPLVQHKLTLIRSHDTGKEMFRHMMAEIGLLMGYEMTRDLKVSSQIVTTPLGEYTGSCVSENKIVVFFRSPVSVTGLSCLSKSSIAWCDT